MQTEPKFQQLVQSLKKPLSIDQFKNLTQRFTVIDTRIFGQKTGLIKGSYWLPGQSLICSWLPILLDPSVHYLLISQRGQLDQILQRFVLMGFMKCMGYNNFDMKQYDGDLEYPVTRKWNQLGDTQKKQFLDVRSPYEWDKTGVVKGAMLIQLKALDRQSEQKLTLLKEISKKKLIVINCRQGLRARIASSILYRHGISPVVLVQSVVDLPKLGVKLISVKENSDYWNEKLQKGLDWSEGDDQDKAERQLQTDNINRMEIEECYQQCLRNHPGKSVEECQRQCEERKRRNHKKRQETAQMQHAQNKNQFQASKMRITPSKLSEQETHFKAVNEQEIQSENQQSKFSKVLRCISEHNYSAASDQLSELIAKNPQNSNFYINRAMCHMKLNEVKQAQYDLNEAIQKDHLNFIPYFDLASLKLSSSPSKQKLFTALQNLYCSLSCMYLKRGLESKSSEDFSKAIQFSPTNLQALAFFSLTKLEKGDLTGCLNILQKMDKHTESKNIFIQKMIKNVQKRMEIQQKSDNPESLKNLTESNTPQETESLIIEHFGSSQFSKRLLGKSITIENNKSLNEEIQRRVQEWNKLYSSMLKQGSSELRMVDEMESETTGMKQSMNQNKMIWIME